MLRRKNTQTAARSDNIVPLRFSARKTNPIIGRREIIYIIPSQSALIKAFDESAIQIINTLRFRFVSL